MTATAMHSTDPNQNRTSAHAIRVDETQYLG